MSTAIGCYIYDDMANTLHDGTVKDWIASFKRGSFPFKHTTGHVDIFLCQPLKISILWAFHINEFITVLVHADKKKISAKWIPNCLNSDEKLASVEILRSISARLKKIRSFWAAVEMYETLVKFSNLETK